MQLSHFGTSGSDQAHAVSVSSTSEFFVAGVTDGALEGASAGASDVFVRLYDSSNQPQWTRQFGTPADDRAFAVAASMDPAYLSSVVYSAGATAGTLVGANRGKYDAFLRSFDRDGKVSWTDQ